VIQIRTTAKFRLQDFFAVIDPKRRKPIMAKIGYMVAREAKANARAKGGKFWADIAGSVSYQATENEVVVGASHEASAHKHFGGWIEAPGKGPGAKKAKALTIPISPIAKGHSAGELATQFNLFRVKDILFGHLKSGEGEAIPLFVLKKRVFHRASPWFPTNRQVFKAIDTVLDFAKV
jgi:hypothetical protein